MFEMAKKIEILDAKEVYEFPTIFEAINDSIGTEYSGWMKACWPNVKGNGNFRMWIPKLAKKRDGELVPAAFDCVNTISDDWNEFVFEDLKGKSRDLSDKYWGMDLIFAKDHSNHGYVFRGVYVRDGEKSKPNYDVSKRIATKVKLVGNPAYDIELLDLTEEAISCDTFDYEHSVKQAHKASLDTLRLAVRRSKIGLPTPVTSTTTQYYRNPYIAEYVKRLAHGYCQLCGEAAPFQDEDGIPYLESHHVVWLAQGGTDTLDNIVALCPNCHRKMHILHNLDDERKLKLIATKQSGDEY